MTLCKSQDSFRKVCKSLNMNEYPLWLHQNAAACVHTLEYGSEIRCVVCIRPESKRTRNEISALLVHEAVHCWQAIRDNIGEAKPGREQEAYAIQRISENLMDAYWSKK